MHVQASVCLQLQSLVPGQHFSSHALHFRSSVGWLEGVGFDESLENGILLCPKAVKVCTGDVVLGLLSDSLVDEGAYRGIAKSAVRTDIQASVGSSVKAIKARRVDFGALLLNRVSELQIPEATLEIDHDRDDDGREPDCLEQPLCDLAVHVI
jgi:hypothetical protein